MNVLRIIDELEQLVEKSPGVMGKKLISEVEFFSTIQRLRVQMPRAMKEAEDVLRKADATLADAKIEAERLINEAKSRNNPFESSTGSPDS